MRHLDEAKSTEPFPVHSFDRVEKLAPGESPASTSTCSDRARALPGEQLPARHQRPHLLGGVMPGSDNVPSEKSWAAHHHTAALMPLTFASAEAAAAG